MASPNAAPKPFQFRLRSIFLATAAVGVALGLLKLGPAGFILVLLPVGPCAAVAILAKSKNSFALVVLVALLWPLIVFEIIMPLVFLPITG
jgi:hypothetical protein